MKLHELKPARGATKRKKRVGRGPGSGHGSTSTRGHKGDQSRSGYKVKRGYEGGQMPLARRIPKRGFNNIFSKKYDVINVSQLNAFKADTVVTPDLLKEKGMIKGTHQLKILGQGDITVTLTVKTHKISKSAQDKIIKAKGKVEIIT
jgi:large subunit ribosomal protein L15